MLFSRTKGNSAISSNMDGPRDYHTKWSKSDKEKYITYAWDLNNGYKWTCLRNRDRPIDLEGEFMVPGGGVGRRDRPGVWDWYIHTAIFKTDNQHGPTAQDRKTCSIFFNNLNGKRIWKIMKNILKFKNIHNFKKEKIYVLIGSICILESVSLHCMVFGFQPRDAKGKEGKKRGREGRKETEKYGILLKSQRWEYSS